MNPTRTPRRSPPDPIPGHGIRRWAIAGGAVVVIAALALLSMPRQHDGPRVLSDQSFVAAANAKCRATLANLRPPYVGDGKHPSADQIAASVDDVAGSLDRLANDLRGLPVSAADQPHVNGWLAQWGDYTTIGRRYGQALRADDKKAQLTVSREGDKVAKQADRFARANGLSHCQFHAVPQGGSDPFSGGM